jgi:hypothetical protein
MARIQATNPAGVAQKVPDRSIPQRATDRIVHSGTNRWKHARGRPRLRIRDQLPGVRHLGLRRARSRRQLVPPPARAGIRDLHHRPPGARAPELAAVRFWYRSAGQVRALPRPKVSRGARRMLVGLEGSERYNLKAEMRAVQARRRELEKAGQQHQELQRQDDGREPRAGALRRVLRRASAALRRRYVAQHRQ